MLLIQTGLIILLILFTSFFVAAEFAIVKLRRTRIESLAASGNKNAKNVLKILDNLDGYLSSCQLGITMTALGLGWLGEPTFEKMLEPLLHITKFPEGVQHIISFSLAFAIVTFLHVVLGELAPKTVAIQKAEKVSMLVAKPLILFTKLVFPFIWILNGSAAVILRLFGMKLKDENVDVHTEDELRLILSESAKSGEINKEEFNYVNNIFTFDNLVARKIMVPRTEMICVFLENGIEKNIKTMQQAKFTRYPVALGDKDQIEGIVNIKEVFQDALGRELKDLTAYIRPVIRVIETIPLKQLLVKMQDEHMHMAILIDEYGGTAGLITVEDILEEIVGDIKDEFDDEEPTEIEKLDHNSYIVDGKLSITEINDMLGIDLEHNGYDTIAGWLLTKNSEIKTGVTIYSQGFQFSILEMSSQQIKKVKIKKGNEEEEEG
jgi:CBS domain containing-hemolysin-like protein